jgi:hypothetical protein
MLVRHKLLIFRLGVLFFSVLLQKQCYFGGRPLKLRIWLFDESAIAFFHQKRPFNVYIICFLIFSLINNEFQTISAYFVIIFDKINQSYLL